MYATFDLSQYMTIPTNNNFPTGNSPYTMEVHCRLDQTQMALIGWGLPNFGKYNVLFLHQNGNLENWSWSAGGNDIKYTPPTTLVDNTFHWLAATHDGTTSKLFVDGVEVASMNRNLNFDSPASNITIGTIVDPNDAGQNATWQNILRFKGGMREIRVWNVARSQSQISSGMSGVSSSSSGLVAHYKFNSNNGLTVSNLAPTGSALDGTLTASVTYVSESSPAFSLPSASVARKQVMAVTMDRSSVSTLSGVPSNQMKRILAVYKGPAGQKAVVSFKGSLASPVGKFRSKLNSAVNYQLDQLIVQKTDSKAVILNRADISGASSFDISVT